MPVPRREGTGTALYRTLTAAGFPWQGGAGKPQGANRRGGSP
ncbi:protein of unknown function [Streptomyces murinus]